MSLIIDSEFRKHRYLGAMETTMAIMHECGLGTTQGVISICLASKLDSDIFNSAVKWAYNCFEILRCVIRENEQGLFFSEEAQIGESHFEPIYTTNQCEWNDIEGDLAHIILPPGSCLWAAHLAYSPNQTLTKILLVSHHAIFDALGATIILNAILEHLDSNGTVNNIDHPISAALDDFLIDSPPPRFFSATPNQTRYKQITGIASRRTQYHRVKIDSETVNLLKNYGLANSVSEQSLISAAFAKAIFDSGLMSAEIDLKTAVALRDFAMEKGMALNSVGCYLGIAAINIQEADLGLLEIARDIQIKNIEFIMDNCLFRSDFEVNSIRERVISLMNNTCFSGFAITHVGKLPITQFCQGFPVVDMKIFTNRVIGNYAVTLQILELESFTAFDFIYVSNLIDIAEVENIGIYFQKNLDFFITS